MQFFLGGGEVPNSSNITSCYIFVGEYVTLTYFAISRFKSVHYKFVKKQGLS